MPLHPSLVHLPLGLAALMPIFAAAFGWACWTGRMRLRAWLVIVALQTLLLTSGLIALQTGRGDEERVEKVVSEAALETHEEAAELFLWAVGVTVIISALAVAMPKPSLAKGVIAASTVLTLVCLALAVRVGHAGGQLVYTHGAASAYVGATPASAGSGTDAGKGLNPATANDDDDSRVEHGKS